MILGEPAPDVTWPNAIKSPQRNPGPCVFTVRMLYWLTSVLQSVNMRHRLNFLYSVCILHVEDDTTTTESRIIIILNNANIYKAP